MVPGPNGAAWWAFQLNDKLTSAVHGSASARQLLKSMADKQQANKAQLFFDAAVLNKYRESEKVRLIRTDTTGRVSQQGSWSVDFGISGDDHIIHVSAEAFVLKVPKAEQEHWLDHIITLPVSDNYLKGLIRPGCIDDGPIRNW